MYAVICKQTGKEISRHKTASEALRVIAVYENADGIEGIYTPGAYEIKNN